MLQCQRIHTFLHIQVLHYGALPYHSCPHPLSNVYPESPLLPIHPQPNGLHPTIPKSLQQEFAGLLPTTRPALHALHLALVELLAFLITLSGGSITKRDELLCLDTN